MGYPKCASCGHEIFDHQAVSCPFCGAGRGKGPVPVARAGSGRRTGPVIARIVLVLTLSAGVFTYLVSTEHADGSRSAKPEELVQDAGIPVEPLGERAPGPVPDRFVGHEACYGGLSRSLDAALRMQTGIEDGSLRKEELDRLDAETRGSCPETGEAYLVESSGRMVTVTCPSHGSASGEW